MHQIVQPKEKKRFGNDTLYHQIQQDALFLIESYGVAVSPDTAGKIISVMPSDEVSRLNYSENTGRFYITQDAIEDCLERVRQGMDFWPAGFGTGGMAAYIVDENGTRLPESSDMKRLAELFGQTDLLTDLHSSFNLCGKVKRTDISKRAQIEVSAIDDMVAGAGGKLVTPTVRSEAAYDRMKYHCDRGYPIGPALSIISTHMTISDEMADLFLKAVTRGLPHVMNSMPIGGLTGPYSMTSLATLAQAQALFGLVLGQLIRPALKP